MPVAVCRGEHANVICVFWLVVSQYSHPPGPWVIGVESRVHCRLIDLFLAFWQEQEREKAKKPGPKQASVSFSSAIALSALVGIGLGSIPPALVTSDRRYTLRFKRRRESPFDGVR